MASEPELSTGNSSLSEALSLSIALLDGDATVSSVAAKNESGEGHNAAATGGGDSSAAQTPTEKAISVLTDLQTQIARSGLISKNDELDDVATSSLELLGVEYHLGRAYLMLPTYPAVGSDGGGQQSSSTGPSPPLLRKRNVTRAMEYFHSFLKRLEQLGGDLLQEATMKEYHAMLDLEDMSDNYSSGGSSSSSKKLNPSQIRDMKIQRFQRKKSATQKRQQLQSQVQRRSRLGIADGEEMEGHDNESLSRTLFIETLRLYAEESLEEMQSSKSELEMLEMAIKMESARMAGGMDPRMNRMPNGILPGHPSSAGGGGRADPRQPQQPLQMTQITQNPITGQLEFTKQMVSNGQLRPVQQSIKRQEIADGVFRPGWNQPTMSLDELAEREKADAIRRSEAQKVAEAEAMLKPRRYDQLERDGMEDDEKLVEASAKLDREWDDWKEENPRGSGNKMSERGDRNF